MNRPFSDLARRVATPLTVTVALGTGCTLASTTDAAAPTAPVVANHASQTQNCEPWTARTVASGLGEVENLLDDGRGSMLLSQLDTGELRRLAPDGSTTTVAEGLPAPGGLARRGRWAYVTTGLTVESATQGIPDGSIERIDLRTGRRETWATGLVSPNGLALLRDGSAVATRTISGAGVLSEVTRVPARDPSQLEPFWSDLTGTNGAAVDRFGRWLYVSRSLESEVWRIPVDDPGSPELVADLGDGSTQLLDDLTVTRDGNVYVADWGSGKVYRIDPATGATCEIASGLPQATAVEPGRGHGFVRGHLYVSSHTGTVFELVPPT